MAVGLTLSLLCALLCVAGAQDAYNDLPAGYRSGVELALKQLNSHSGVNHHFRFLKTIDKAEINSGFGVKYLYQHFYLKPTRCAKGTTDPNPQSCPFRNDRPLMDCAVCYKTASDQIEAEPKPYVHCMQKPRLTEAMMTDRTDHCKKMVYNSGAPTLLSVSTEEGVHFSPDFRIQEHIIMNRNIQDGCRTAAAGALLDHAETVDLNLSRSIPPGVEKSWTWPWNTSGVFIAKTRWMGNIPGKYETGGRRFYHQFDLTPTNWAKETITSYGCHYTEEMMSTSSDHCIADF